MANTPDLAACLEVGPGQDDAVLPINPFLAVRYQFGMLLGAEDFDTAEGYPRGKMRLHNAWLHGAGVVWGFDVQAPQTSPPTDISFTGAILVKAGLALDEVGHELYLDQDACVDVGAWYALHKDDQAVKDAADVDAGTGVVMLDLHVELSFAACLARQVPAMSEPCAGATGTSTAYSRARELVKLALVPDKAAERVDHYPTLRYLFGLASAPAAEKCTAHQADAIAAVNGGWTDQGQFLDVLRKCAVADETAMEAATVPPLGKKSYFPAADEAPPVVLANLTGVTLTPQAGGTFKMTHVDIDVNVRPSHVATSTIQELHCCPPRAPLEVTAPTDSTPPADTTAPTAAPSANATLSTKRPVTITLESLALPFDDSTVDGKAFSVTHLTGDGWTEMEAKQVDTDGKKVSIVLRGAPPKGSLLRLVARGTGPMPLMCIDADTRVPFRGDFGRGSKDDGSDFVIMWEVK